MVSVRDLRVGDSGTPRNGTGALSMIGAAAEIAEALQAIHKKGDHPLLPSPGEKAREVVEKRA
jgi:hypothetical protein